MAWLIGATCLADSPITLEKIMQHPRWIGMWPEEVRYSPDGGSIFYLSHADPRGYEVVEITEQGEVVKIHDTTSLPVSGDRLGGRSVHSFLGDLFVDGARLTRTTASETECRWLGPKRIVFRRGGDYFVRDLGSGTERQLAQFVFKSEKEKKPKFREQQQDRLFPVLKEREEGAEREKLVPEFNLGKKRELVRLEVSPNEKYALAVHGKKSKSKRDKMPVYLNRDGTVSTKNLRPKVGERKAKDHRLAVLDLRRGSKRAIDLSVLPGFSEKTTVYLGDTEWSDGGRLALSLFSEDFEERWIVEVLLEQAELRLVEHLHDDAWHAWDLNEFGWASEKLWYQSEKTGWAHLYLWDGGAARPLTSGRYEVTSIHPTPDGNAFFYRANKENPGRYNVYRTTLTGKTERVTDLGGQTFFDMAPDGKSLVLLHSKTGTPPELFLQQARSGARPRQITHLANQEFLGIDWTLPRFVDVPSTHQERPIHSKLYLPPQGVTRNGAAVVFVHGAGYLQNSDEGWSYYFREFMFHTLLTRRGVAVLDMDYRASAGYGRDWRTAIYRQMGTPELEDLQDGVAYMVKEYGVDARRVGVYGGSYGGFITLMALFKEPDLFACGAALRPVTDWAQYEHGYTARILNTPKEDPEAYLRSSPIEFAEGLSKPLLLCHGMLDDNVVAQDTVRLAQRLIQLKKENWEMALYPVEPHGFIEPESWLDEYRRIYKLFEANLEI